MVLKRNHAGLIEIYRPGWIRFRPEKFARALGDPPGSRYRESLERIAPAAMGMSYPAVAPDEAGDLAPKVYDLIRNALGETGLGANVG